MRCEYGDGSDIMKDGWVNIPTKSMDPLDVLQEDRDPEPCRFQEGGFGLAAETTTVVRCPTRKEFVIVMLLMIPAAMMIDF